MSQLALFGAAPVQNEGWPRQHSEGPALCYALLMGTWSVVSTTVGDGREAYTMRRTTSSPGRRRPLSTRERAVLFLALRGHANKWIAAELGISKSAVSTLLERGRRKLAGEIPERLLRALCASQAGARSPLTSGA